MNWNFTFQNLMYTGSDWILYKFLEKLHRPNVFIFARIKVNGRFEYFFVIDRIVLIILQDHLIPSNDWSKSTFHALLSYHAI